ncbi:uncharacterized protein VTP21DRAFT_578 [Calcarisporiella thermophila]|uniref:uncharacterized protein n=1 Tax=Calcarisporiella thermophila TaxID=911321 RepID=UPI003744323A
MPTANATGRKRMKHHILLFLTLLALPEYALLAPTDTSNTLTPRFHHTTTLLGTKNLIIGGTTDVSNTLASTIIFHDLLTSTAQDVPAPSLLVSGHSVIPIMQNASIFPNLLIIFGITSFSTSPPKFLQNALLYDPTLGVINSFEFSAPFPPPRNAQTATLVGLDKIVVLGGLTANAQHENAMEVLGDAWIFDLKTITWSRIPTLGFEPVFGHTTVSVADTFLVSCFGMNAKQDEQNSCTLLHLPTLKFIEPIYTNGLRPPPRSSASLLLSPDGRTIIAFGGVNFKTGPYGDMWLLDVSRLPEMAWKPVDMTDKGGPIPGPRSGHTATAVGPDGSVMMVWGGAVNETALADTQAYYYDMKTFTWADESIIRAMYRPRLVNTIQQEPLIPTRVNTIGIGNNDLIDATKSSIAQRLEPTTIVAIGVCVGVVFATGSGLLICFFCRRMKRNSNTQSNEFGTAFEGNGDDEKRKMLKASPPSTQEKKHHRETEAYDPMDDYYLQIPSAPTLTISCPEETESVSPSRNVESLEWRGDFVQDPPTTSWNLSRKGREAMLITVGEGGYCVWVGTENIAASEPMPTIQQKITPSIQISHAVFQRAQSATPGTKEPLQPSEQTSPIKSKTPEQTSNAPKKRLGIRSVVDAFSRPTPVPAGESSGKGRNLLPRRSIGELAHRKFLKRAITFPVVRNDSPHIAPSLQACPLRNSVSSTGKLSVRSLQWVGFDTSMVDLVDHRRSQALVVTNQVHAEAKKFESEMESISRDPVASKEPRNIISQIERNTTYEEDEHVSTTGAVGEDEEGSDYVQRWLQTDANARPPFNESISSRGVPILSKSATRPPEDEAWKQENRHSFWQWHSPPSPSLRHSVISVTTTIGDSARPADIQTPTSEYNSDDCNWDIDDIGFPLPPTYIESEKSKRTSTDAIGVAL